MKLASLTLKYCNNNTILIITQNIRTQIFYVCHLQYIPTISSSTLNIKWITTQDYFIWCFHERIEYFCCKYQEWLTSRSLLPLLILLLSFLIICLRRFRVLQMWCTKSKIMIIWSDVILILHDEMTNNCGVNQLNMCVICCVFINFLNAAYY